MATLLPGQCPLWKESKEDGCVMISSLIYYGTG